MFFSPLYTAGSDARQVHESAMTQAIGRSRRLGQEKTVKVYELLATYTVDVDYREHRGDCILQCTASNQLRQATRTDDFSHGPLSSAIAHRTQFDG